MTADLVGIVYNATSKVVRAIIIPEVGDGLGDANLLNQQKNPPDNCAVATIARASLTDTRIPTVIAGINQAQGLGLLPPAPCTLVDKDGTVQDVVLADPIHTPTHNGFTVIKNTVGAGHGDKWDGASFKRDYAIVNKATGLVLALQTVTLKGDPNVNANQEARINNDRALKVGDVVGVQIL